MTFFVITFSVLALFFLVHKAAKEDTITCPCGGDCDVIEDEHGVRFDCEHFCCK